MPGCFAAECQHHSMRNPCQMFRFPTADSQLKKVVAFVHVRVFVRCRIRQYAVNIAMIKDTLSLVRMIQIHVEIIVSLVLKLV